MKLKATKKHTTHSNLWVTAKKFHKIAVDKGHDSTRGWYYPIKIDDWYNANKHDSKNNFHLYKQNPTYYRKSKAALLEYYDLLFDPATLEIFAPAKTINRTDPNSPNYSDTTSTTNAPTSNAPTSNAPTSAYLYNDYQDAIVKTYPQTLNPQDPEAKLTSPEISKAISDKYLKPNIIPRLFPTIAMNKNPGTLSYSGIHDFIYVKKDDTKDIWKSSAALKQRWKIKKYDTWKDEVVDMFDSNHKYKTGQTDQKPYQSAAYNTFFNLDYKVGIEPNKYSSIFIPLPFNFITGRAYSRGTGWINNVAGSRAGRKSVYEIGNEDITQAETHVAYWRLTKAAVEEAKKNYHNYLVMTGQDKISSDNRTWIKHTKASLESLSIINRHRVGIITVFTSDMDYTINSDRCFTSGTIYWKWYRKNAETNYQKADNLYKKERLLLAPPHSHENHYYEAFLWTYKYVPRLSKETTEKRMHEKDERLQNMSGIEAYDLRCKWELSDRDYKKVYNHWYSNVTPGSIYHKQFTLLEIPLLKAGTALPFEAFNLTRPEQLTKHDEFIDTLAETYRFSRSTLLDWVPEFMIPTKQESEQALKKLKKLIELHTIPHSL